MAHSTRQCFICVTDVYRRSLRATYTALVFLPQEQHRYGEKRGSERERKKPINDSYRKSMYSVYLKKRDLRKEKQKDRKSQVLLPRTCKLGYGESLPKRIAKSSSRRSSTASFGVRNNRLSFLHRTQMVTSEYGRAVCMSFFRER